MSPWVIAGIACGGYTIALAVLIVIGKAIKYADQAHAELDARAEQAPHLANSVSTPHLGWKVDDELAYRNAVRRRRGGER